MAHYIATDSDLNTVYGIGDSPEAAIADARRGAGEDAEFVTVPATQRLIDRVSSFGGGHDLSWTVVGNASGRPVGNGWDSYEHATAVLDVDLDDEEIEALQLSAGQHGDNLLVDTCDDALNGNYLAREIVRGILDDAAAAAAAG